MMMKKPCRWMVMFILSLIDYPVFADMPLAQMSVWVNEAIVALYTYRFDDMLSHQKDIAHYFTAKGWIGYMQALNASKLSDDVKKNHYIVSAVATLPPSIKKVGAVQWEAMMPVLVLYKNSDYQQKQVLDVIINFAEAASGEGVRGLAITSIQTKKASLPCRCEKASAQQ